MSYPADSAWHMFVGKIAVPFTILTCLDNSSLDAAYTDFRCDVSIAKIICSVWICSGVLVARPKQAAPTYVPRRNIRTWFSLFPWGLSEMVIRKNFRMKHITNDFLVQTFVYLCSIPIFCSRSDTVLTIFMQVITAVPYSMGRPSFQWGESTELPGRLFFNPLSISRCAGHVGSYTAWLVRLWFWVTKY